MSRNELVAYAGTVSNNKHITIYAHKDYWPIPTIWRTEYICSWFNDYKDGVYFIPGKKISNFECQFIYVKVREKEQTNQ